MLPKSLQSLLEGSVGLLSKFPPQNPLTPQPLRVTLPNTAQSLCCCIFPSAIVWPYCCCYDLGLSKNPSLGWDSKSTEERAGISAWKPPCAEQHMQTWLTAMWRGKFWNDRWMNDQNECLLLYLSKSLQDAHVGPARLPPTNFAPLRVCCPCGPQFTMSDPHVPLVARFSPPSSNVWAHIWSKIHVGPLNPHFLRVNVD